MEIGIFNSIDGCGIDITSARFREIKDPKDSYDRALGDMTEKESIACEYPNETDFFPHYSAKSNNNN